MTDNEPTPPPLPPLPVEDPPPPPEEQPSPPPPLPPPSTQTSNQVTDWLDFDTDVGGLNSTNCEPPAKRVKLDSEAAEDPREEAENDGTPTNSTLNVCRHSPIIATIVNKTPDEQYDSLEEGEIQDGTSHKDVPVSSSSEGEGMASSSSDQLAHTAGSIQPGMSVDATVNCASNLVSEVSQDGGSDSEDLIQYLKNVANHVPQEFEIIDDLASDDDGHSLDSDDFDEDEIDAMLEDGLSVYFKPNRAGNEDEFAKPIEREKVVLKGK